MWFLPRPDPKLLVPPPMTASDCRVDDDICRAQAAQRDTRQRFIEAVHEGEEIRQVASEMKIRRVRNGYEDLIEDAMMLRTEKRR